MTATDQADRLHALLMHDVASVDANAALTDVRERADRRYGAAPLAAARRSRVPLLVSIAAVTIALLVGFIALRGGTRAPTTSTAGVPDGGGKSAPPRAQDVYDDQIAAIKSGVALPSTRPPGVQSVTLTSVDGHELLIVEYADVNVLMCSSAPCGEASAPIRTVQISGATYVIEYQGHDKASVTAPPLPDALREYWTAAAFVNARPAWLTPDLQAGVAPR